MGKRNKRARAVAELRKNAQKNATAEVAEAPKAKSVQVITTETGFAFDFREVEHEQLGHVVQAVIQGQLGYGIAHQYDFVYPADVIFGIKGPLIGHLKNVEEGGAETIEKISELDKIYEGRALENYGKGRIEFEDVTRLIKKDDEVLSVHDGMTVGGRVVSTKVKRNWMGMRFLHVQLSVVHAFNGKPEECHWTTDIYQWPGLLELDKLPLRRVTDEDKARLAPRGKIFSDFVAKSAYVSYQGQLTQFSYWGSRHYRASGRVMLDPAAMRQVRNDQFRTEVRGLNLELRDEDDDVLSERVQFELSPSELWRCFPFTLGFSFVNKQWGRLALDNLSAIQWRTEAFDQLVLDEERKNLVRALVENQGETFTDIIDGKGGGTIFLLHGPPGQGKTLTAEAIAERLKRPLYSISVGELGVSPEELEEKLREVLDIATTWNAVVLMDEADIFLEARDERDIVRNAMVGVFLRLLEYHQGVLFLTTNRVKNIDRAFYSRISIGLFFEDATVQKRQKIWDNLLQAAKITKINTAALAQNDVNGRQVKNIIRQAQALTHDIGEKKVTQAMLEKVLALTTSFESDINQSKQDQPA